MNRRTLLKLLAAAPALALDPERLLWVSGAKKIFVPDNVLAFRIAEAKRLIAEVEREMMFGTFPHNPDKFEGLAVRYELTNSPDIDSVTASINGRDIPCEYKEGIVTLLKSPAL